MFLKREIAQLRKTLTKNGYRLTTRSSERYGVYGMKGDASIRLTSIGWNTISPFSRGVKLYRKTPRGGWVQISEVYCHTEREFTKELKKVMAEANAINNEEFKNFKPFSFSAEKYFYDNHVCNAAFLLSAKTISVVTINDNGMVTKEAYNPEKRPWFLIEGTCQSVSGPGYVSACSLLSDGKNWCPIRKTGRDWVLELGFRTLNYDAKSFNITDQELICEAISVFLSPKEDAT